MDGMNENKMNIYSYNSRGFGDDKQDICKILATKNKHIIPIICVQEHFLLRANNYKVKQCLPDFHVYFKTAVMDSEFGRPKNGMFIGIPNDIKEHVTDVSPSHWRIQAILLEVSDCKILLINSYFPTDPRIQDFDTEELLTTLQAINGVIENTSFDTLLLTGDLNSDFSRNTRFVTIVKQFIDDHNLNLAWNTYPVDHTHISEIDGKSFTSTIDHFAFSKSLDDKIEDAGVLYLPGNTSDHHPIYCTIQEKCLKAQSKIPSSTEPYKPSWKKATAEERETFHANLTENLTNMPSTVSCCKNVHCDDANHLQSCDDRLVKLLECISHAATSSLPGSTPKMEMNSGKKNLIPRWKEDIEPFREAAQFWHAVWLSAGKPQNTELHNLMKRTRNIYHFHIRKNKRMANTLKRNNIMNACFGDHDIDIFKEIKKMRRCPRSIATEIDGQTTDIPDHFAKIYKELYNSVDDEKEIQNIERILHNSIGDSSINEVMKVTPEIVCEATKHLKGSKTDPVVNFSSDCIKAAPMVFYEHLANIFQSFLIHSHVSKVLLISTLVPLVKDKLGDICTWTKCLE